MKISEIICKIREQANLNDPQLSLLLNCSQASISRLRRGIQNPSYKLANDIIKLAKKHKIHVTMNDILQD